MAGLNPDPLHLQEQTIEAMLDARYWREVCPFLTVERDTQRERQAGGNEENEAAVVAVVASPEVVLLEGEGERNTKAGEKAAGAAAAEAAAEAAMAGGQAHEEQGASHSGPDAAALRTRLNDHGFVCLSAADLAPVLQRGELVARLARGVARLLALGHSASAIGVYDEHWELQRRLAPLLEAVTGNTPNGDCFSFHRSARSEGAEDAAAAAAAAPSSSAPCSSSLREPRHFGNTTSGFGNTPHRDKPAAGADTFRADGAAMYCTVWIALTDASPRSSCLYVIPKELDAGYHLGGDALGDAGVCDPSAFQNIRAAPVDAGGGCVFSHRLVHWGSRPAADYTGAPRLALSYALTDQRARCGGVAAGEGGGTGGTGFAASEAEFYDHARHAPFPPLRLRVALRAGQAVLYARQVPHAHKGALGLNTRLWRAGAHLFRPGYRDKVNAAAQWERFLESRK